MKKILLLSVALLSLNTAWAAQDTAPQKPSPPSTCNNENTPKVVKPMENWDIIATNTGTIHMSAVFSGDKLAYSIAANPTNKKNKVTINKKTGDVKVVAEKKDNFDVTVQAKNTCGKVSNKFNVEIDEET